jgi:hypothetical protein
MTRRTTVTSAAIAVLGALLVLPSIEPLATSAHAASGKQVHYIGIHPVPKVEGGGLCYIEAPHVHVFEVDRLQYRDHHGASFFVGDPVAYGYDGPRYAYKGHHPIHVHVVLGAEEPDEEYCYLNGPHYHYFAPPEGPDFQLAGDAYFFVGEPPRVYVEARPVMMKINAVYQPLVYERPVITVEAPAGWIGARAEFAVVPVVAAPRGAVVVAPPSAGVSVQAVIPAPSLRIGVGIGVGVGVGVGAGVAVRERSRPVIIEKRGKAKVRHRNHRRD